MIAAVALAVVALLGAGASPATAGAQSDRAVSAHPRIFLDAAALAGIRAGAAAPTPAWKALEKRCKLHAKGDVEWPDGDDYPSRSSDIGEGYQGDGYYSPLLGLGLCYQATIKSEPKQAKRYAAVGTEILVKMSAVKGPHAESPLRDSGYGIRNFGSGMAIGFDWLYKELSRSERARIETAIKHWIKKFERGGFERKFPAGNYFAGYYAAKAYGALATEGEGPGSGKLWSDWLNRVHLRLVQPYYAANLSGGGWPEGWNYGPQATVNMSLPALAVKTARGIDLATADAPYAFPLSTPRTVMHSSWPNRTTIEDSGFLYEGEAPSALPNWFVTIEAGLLRGLGDEFAPAFESFAAAVRASAPGGELGVDWEAWSNFLFEPPAPAGDFATEPLSRYAGGMELAAMRSGWDPGAVWALFRAGPYTGYPDAAEQFYDQGSIAIVNGAKPLLVNAIGALLRHSPGTADGTRFFTPVLDSVHSDKAKRELFNVFYVNQPKATGQGAHLRRDGNAARISHFDDGGRYVFARGTELEDNYPANDGETSPISSWTRDVVFIRPGLFVIDDRTTVSDPAVDQWMAFHVGATPATAGPSRLDVGSGGDYRGTMHTLLPAGAGVRNVNVFDSGKVFRLELRPPAPAASQRWLTVFEAAPSAAAAAAASPLSAAAGNVEAGDAVGALLSAAGASTVVLGAGAAGGPIAGEARYRIPAAATTHVVRDLEPGASYAVTATATDPQTISIAPGAGFTATAAGVVSFSTTAAGAVSNP